jgi:hypothetical protein
MHNQNVNGVRRSAREGITVGVDDTWPVITAATDAPIAALSCAISIARSRNS